VTENSVNAAMLTHTGNNNDSHTIQQQATFKVF